MATGTNQHDALVVGGGHNGLVAAAYLARAGLDTLVLEGRPRTGGAATTERPWPELPHVSVTRLSYVMSLMPPSILADLELARHGYRVHPMGPYYQAFPDGGSITIHDDDPARTREQIARWSPHDARAWEAWNEWLTGLADVLGPLLLTVPPAVGSHAPGDLVDLARLVWRNRGVDVRTVAEVTRLMTMSIADLLDEWFESPQVKGAMAVNGVIGTWAGPYEPGTAYVMAHHSIGDVGDGQLGSWGFPEGGMGAVADAIRSAAESFGARVRTDAPVSSLLVSGGRVHGAVLANGEELHAPVVVSSVHPRVAFLEHVGAAHLPEDFVRDIERWRSRSGVVKINLALDRLPSFTADPSDGHGGGQGDRAPEHLTGSVEMAPTMEFTERAFLDAREGRPAAAPFCDGVIPTTVDRTLNPDGTHVFSMFTQWVPEAWHAEPHDAELAAYADRLIDLYDQVAPGFRDSVIARDIVGPHEMETAYGLVGGNIFHGELSLEQLFHLRLF
jgi:phytoene dehydrogenase-like protein